MRKMLKIFRKNRLKSNGQIIVLGDSHSRSFAHNQNFFPVFLGAGKHHNFISSENFKIVLNKSLKVLNKLNQKDVLFFFGEPDTRYALGKGWYPWDEKEHINLDHSKLICSSTDYYLKLANKLRKSGRNVMVLNVILTPRRDQNLIVKKYNTTLKYKLKSYGIPFFEINSLIEENGVISEHYYGDQVHASNRIQPLVEKLLINLKLIDNSNFDNNYIWDIKKVQSEFELNDKFGCYVLKK